MLKKTKIILAIVLPIVLVVGGGGFYYAAFHPMRGNLQEKPVVKLPTKYVNALRYWDYGDEYRLYHNGTPLAEYWEREYLRTHLWNISTGNITLSIYPLYIIGDSESESVALNITLRSRGYLEGVKYVLDGTESEIKNHGDIMVLLVESKNVSQDRVDYKDWTWATAEIFKFQDRNISFWTHAYFNLNERKVNGTLSYNFTAYIETKEKMYEMKFVFNLPNEHYPFLDLQDLYYMGNYSFYIPGAKYFCYTPYGKNKVVISNHIMPGTKYFFAEKDGVLSAITRYLPEQKYVKKDFYVNKLFYFTPNELNATILNSTPLAKYWEKEYLKSHEWEMNVGGISIEVYPIYFLGYNGTFLGYNTTKGQLILNSIVNSTKYVGNITYTLNALKAIPLNGAYFDTAVAPQGNPLNNGAHYKRVYRNYMEDWQEVKYAFNTENFTFSSQLYLNISYWTASEIPYSVTITLEQKDYYHDMLENITHYTLQIHFSLVREEYPFLEPNTTGHNVTYFCYNASWGKVVISNHLVPGTQYYFVEKNGVLSAIWTPHQVIYGRFGE